MMVYRRTLTEKQVVVRLKTTGEKRQRTLYEFGYYSRPEGGTKLNGSTVKACKALVLPPAGKDMVIDLGPKAKIVATWTDVKGRRCSMYSKKHQRQAHEEKFDRAETFAKALPKIMTRVKKDMRLDNKCGEAANVLYLISQTAFRLGGTCDTKADTKAFGAATLLGKHVKTIEGDTVTFDFIGKKGVRIRKTIHDPIIARMMMERKSTCWSENLFDVSPGFVRAYLQEITPEFVVKDFRTHLATAMARDLVSQRKGPAPNQTRFKKWQRQVAMKVAKLLNNTKPVALNSYINGSVWQAWEQPAKWPVFVPKAMKGDE